MKDFHPVANIFPLMAGAEFDALVFDIAEHGQYEPIWLYEDRVLDGRNRLRACGALGLVPEFREYTGDDPQAFVVSLNLHRRHLTREQRDEVIRQLRTNGMTLQKIANVVGVSVGKVHSVASELFNSEKLPGDDGKYRPMQYVTRMVKVEEEDYEEGEFGDDYDENADACWNCKHYHGELIRTNGWFCAALSCDFSDDTIDPPCRMKSMESWELDPEFAPEAIDADGGKGFVAGTRYPVVAANHADIEGDDWCRPIEYVEAVREVLEAIDLDPATNEYGQSVIMASTHYTKQDDGLAQDWNGFSPRFALNSAADNGVITAGREPQLVDVFGHHLRVAASVATQITWIGCQS